MVAGDRDQLKTRVRARLPADGAVCGAALESWWKSTRSLIRTYQTSGQKAGMTSHPKRPRDDLYRSRLQPSQLAALDGWIANQDASLTSGLPNSEKAK